MLVDTAYQVLENEHPMTLRQLFYRLVSHRVLDNQQADYLKLSRFMTDARTRGEVPFEWMVDRSRPSYRANVFADPGHYAEVVKRAYRKDYWEMQPVHVEVWTEKDAIVGAIEPVTGEYGVEIRVGRGFLSTTRAHEIGERFSAIDKPIHVLYLGDHDPSGTCIERDAQRRVARQTLSGSFEAVMISMLGGDPDEGDTPFDCGFTMKRIAIHPEDIKAFNLPPLRIKARDPRAASFYRRHGGECVEVDALPPSELRRRLDEAISALIDRTAWDRAIAVEQTELASIKRIAGDIARLRTGHVAEASGEPSK